MRPSRHKHTFDEGQLIPFYVDDVLPGDTFNLRARIFGRLATPIFPLMDNMYFETFWFFIPNRLVWDNFQKQHGERVDPDDSTDYTTPQILMSSVGAPTIGSIWDQFGLPMQNLSGLNQPNAPISLPFRMYNLVYNEWFRDQDLQDSLPVPRGDGPDNMSNFSIQRIGKYKDYFTTCRPAPQKGPDVTFPLGESAPVSGLVTNTGIVGDSVIGAVTPTPYGQLQLAATKALQSQNAPGGLDAVRMPITGTINLENGPTPASADLTEATLLTVNAFREVVTIQQMYELDMRGGTRYIEMIFNHYGVTNPDFRLQRPEFLGYGKSTVNIHPVQQTSQSDETPQGNLAAFGTFSQNNGFVKTFTEFGYILGLVAVRADLSYQEGLDRHWSRLNRFDYYYPIFANLGEQAVLRKEAWLPADSSSANEAFGFQERWAEYRFKTSKVTGLFRSSAPQSLDAWHLSQEFASSPTLGSTFIQEDAPVDRVIAVPSEPHFFFDSIVENNTARAMPVYSAPGLMRI